MLLRSAQVDPVRTFVQAMEATRQSEEAAVNQAGLRNCPQEA